MLAASSFGEDSQEKLQNKRWTVHKRAAFVVLGSVPSQSLIQMKFVAFYYDGMTILLLPC